MKGISPVVKFIIVVFLCICFLGLGYFTGYVKDGQTGGIKFDWLKIGGQKKKDDSSDRKMKMSPGNEPGIEATPSGVIISSPYPSPEKSGDKENGEKGNPSVEDAPEGNISPPASDPSNESETPPVSPMSSHEEIP